MSSPKNGGDQPPPGIDRDQERKRSNVRIYVTYCVTAGYTVTAVGLVAWLMWKGRSDLALGVFSGLSAVATGVIGFWFGNRSRARAPDQPAAQAGGKV